MMPCRLRLNSAGSERRERVHGGLKPVLQRRETLARGTISRSHKAVMKMHGNRGACFSISHSFHRQLSVRCELDLT